MSGHIEEISVSLDLLISVALNSRLRYMSKDQTLGMYMDLPKADQDERFAKAKLTYRDVCLRIVKEYKELVHLNL